MARDFLSEYGPDKQIHKADRATTGGIKSARDVMNYKPPQGPTNIRDPKGPGIHGDRHGMAHCTTAGRGSGHTGIGGTTHKSGSQRG